MMTPYFNSIKVRLELNLLNTAHFPKGFQFHKGAIRTDRSRYPSGTTYSDFNSIKVRLEHNADDADKHNIQYFNSIKVRLELLMAASEPPDKPQFQFHKGAIRTR